MRIEHKEVRHLDVGIYCLMLDCLEYEGVQCLVGAELRLQVIFDIMKDSYEAITETNQQIPCLASRGDRMIKFRNGSSIYFTPLVPFANDIESIRGRLFHSALIVGHIHSDFMDAINNRLEQYSSREIAYVYQTFNY